MDEDKMNNENINISNKSTDTDMNIDKEDTEDSKVKTENTSFKPIQIDN